ncbi:tyrosine-type recombinase/integrase [Eggerthella sinensis]|uniref:tyrosine-type recombinase/integrase n=1 Tax=Eggerthella sinensis TaxID=242230 RepID=UPI00266B5FCB|nr:site-specific integrase [Eggerthella sinensis]
MATVPRNKGSYTARKNGTFQVKFPLGWSDEKKKYDEYREDAASEAEAIALIKTINDYVYHGGDVTEVPAWRSGKKAEEASSSMTVEQFADEFTTIREKQRKVEPRTIESDRECFARIKPYIGKKLLGAVTPHDIDEAYARMRSDGPDNLGGHAYSGTTLQKTHAFLSMLFDKAVDYEYVAKNPLDRVERPKRDTAEKISLSPEQAQSVFKQVTDNPLEAKTVGMLLCLSCGLRISEMLALKWSDYSSGIISVNKSLVKNKQEFKSTKNGEERSVPCPPPLIAVLDDWMVEQKSWYEEKELVWSRRAPIVQSRVGNHVLQRSYEKWFAAVKANFGLPANFTVHGFRHTFVTLLNRDCGVDPRTTRSLSGHKSEQAFAIYTHTDSEWQRKAACDLGAIIAPDDASMRCQNCKLWTMSPNDATKGACWSNDDIVIVTNSLMTCSTGRFATKAMA